MQSRAPSAIGIGIVQFLALFFLVPSVVNFLEAQTKPWTISENTMLIVGLLLFFIVYLPYPIYLFRKKRKNEGIIILLTSVLCAVLWIAFVYRIVSGLSVID